MRHINFWPCIKSALLVLSLLGTQHVNASDKYWVCNTDRWDALCWSNALGGPAIYNQPLAYDNVYLTQSDVLNRTVTYYNSAYPTAVLYSLQIDATGSGLMTLSQDLYAHNLSSINENIGINGSGIHTQSLGTNTVQNYLILGKNVGSNGSYILSGTGNLTANNEAVGLFGNGTFTQTGGSHQSSSLTIATHATGAYNQSGGTNQVLSNLDIGNSATSSGSYNLSGTASLMVGSTGPIINVGTETVGRNGMGTFTQTGGTHTVNGYLNIGASANGTYNQSGGTVNVSGLNIGLYSGSTGTYIQTAGDVTAGSVIIGGNGSNGSYNLSGTAYIAASNEIIGQAGIGTFNQSGGINIVNNTLYVGYYSYSNGTYNLSAGSLTVNDEHIGYSSPGYSGTGNFTQTGGTHTVNNNLTIGYGGTGAYTLSGGEHTVGGDLNLSYISGSSGTYNLNAGSFTVGGDVTKGIGTSILNIGGGNLIVGGGNGSVDVGNLVLGSISGANVNYTLLDTGLYENTNKIAGALTTSNLTLGKDGTGTFTQNGGTNTISGTVTLAANAGSSGTYNLNDGVLRATTITVNSGGTFNFNGGTLSVDQFNGDLANLGGTLAPGNSPGVTNITGNYSQSETGIFAVEIGGAGLGQFDILNISGTATLDGTLNVSLFDWGSGLFTPQVGDSFDILTAQMLSGQFSTYNLAALGDGLAWNISYLTDAIDTTDIVRLSVVSAVPVPPAIWLFGSGLLGLIGIARKRKFH